MTLTLAILFGLFLAYANGANDNFKGVATLYGSGTTSYKRALLWATDQKPSLPSCSCSFMAVSITYLFPRVQEHSPHSRPKRKKLLEKKRERKDSRK
jgi:hypothetical protein